MSAPKDGGSAFPHGALSSGMSLRDWFAGQAIEAAAARAEKGVLEYELMAMFGNRGGIRREQIIAGLAYTIADAMLAERERRQP